MSQHRPATPQLIRPPAVPTGATIAVVSTSWGGIAALPERAARGIAALEGLGYDVRLMPNARGARDGLRDWVSGSVEQRLADLHAAFRDPEIDLVLSAIGGDHSAQLLEGLDLDLIAANPKPFCGYSDTTTLVHAIHARTGLVTFYGPALLPEFGELGGPDPEVVAHFQQVLGSPAAAGALPTATWQATEPRQLSDPAGRRRHRHPGEPRRVLRPGHGSGPLLAGCLPCCRNLIGTDWQPDYAGRVLVIEPPEAPYDAERADGDLTHLRNAGLLSDLAALVVGRTDGWSTEQVAAFDACVLDSSRGFDYPVLAGVECSHSAPLFTFPLGIRATVDGLDLVFDEPAVAG